MQIFCIFTGWWMVVMSPSRAGSSHSSSWSIFSSARLGSWPFCFSSDLFFSARKSENCHFLLGAEKATYKKTFQNYVLWKWEFLSSKIPVLRIHTIKTLLIVQIYISTFFLGPKNLTIKGYKKKSSSVSARKLKCHSSARLGSEPSKLGSAWAGKFRLGLITSIWGP